MKLMFKLKWGQELVLAESFQNEPLAYAGLLQVSDVGVEVQEFAERTLMRNSGSGRIMFHGVLRHTRK